MDEFDLIKKYFVPISSIESQNLSDDGAVFKPKKDLGLNTAPSFDNFWLSIDEIGTKYFLIKSNSSIN